MHKVWIEAALNGAWGRERQPAIPITVTEVIADGIAAAEAGAAIVHIHAYDADTGRQNDDWATYAAIIEGIRAKVDAIVYPTIPFAESGFDGQCRTAVQRFTHVEELARRGLLEMSALDPGSANFVRFDELPEDKTGIVYQNPLDHIREGLRIAAFYRVRPCYAIYEPGFTRLGAALAALHPHVPAPVYRFMFSDDFAWGFPPRQAYLEAHLSLLSEVDPGGPWMVAGLGVNIFPLLPVTIALGGHIRVGLEDAPWGSSLTNSEWVQITARKVIEAGGEPATAAEIRKSLTRRNSRNNA
jgi:3-keto-5-aminohexanoate cleavage enzyme